MKALINPLPPIANIELVPETVADMELLAELACGDTMMPITCQMWRAMDGKLDS